MKYLILSSVLKIVIGQFVMTFCAMQWCYITHSTSNARCPSTVELIVVNVLINYCNLWQSFVLLRLVYVDVIQAYSG